MKTVPELFTHLKEELNKAGIKTLTLKDDMQLIIFNWFDGQDLVLESHPNNLFLKHNFHRFHTVNSVLLEISSKLKLEHQLNKDHENNPTTLEPRFYDVYEMT